MAAPMLCGGVTVFRPLKQYGAGTTAKDVGIVGIGGLVRMLALFHPQFSFNPSVLRATLACSLPRLSARMSPPSHTLVAKRRMRNKWALLGVCVFPCLCYFTDSFLWFAVIATGDGSSKNFEPYAHSLDLIICTVGE